MILRPPRSTLCPYPTLFRSHGEGGPLDLPWLAGVLLMALAARSAHRHVSSRQACETTARLGWRVLAVPLACNLISLSVLAAGFGNRCSPVAAWAATGCVLAALARTAVTFREVR